MQNKPEKVNIIFLHGAGQNKTIWQDIIDLLPKDKYNAKAIDLIGFGKRKFTGQLNLEIWAEDVEKYITKYFKNPPIIVGLSLGSYIILEILRRNNIKLKKVILIGALFNGKFAKSYWKKIVDFAVNHPFGERFIDLICNSKFLVNDLADFIVHPEIIFKSNDLDRNDYRFTFNSKIINKDNLLATAQGLQATFRANYAGFLKHNKQSIVVLIGDHEIVISPIYAKKWQKFPHVKLKILPNCGHNTIITKQAQVVVKEIIK